jgi:RNA polymerase sigma-70 factor, ECF subfamily
MNSTTRQFEQASRLYMDAIYTRAIRLTKNAPKAEELVQLTYLRAFTAFAHINKKIDLKRWLLRMLNETYQEVFTEAEISTFKAGQEMAAVH